MRVRNLDNHTAVSELLRMVPLWVQLQVAGMVFAHLWLGWRPARQFTPGTERRWMSPPSTGHYILLGDQRAYHEIPAPFWRRMGEWAQRERHWRRKFLSAWAFSIALWLMVLAVDFYGLQVALMAMQTFAATQPPYLPATLENAILIYGVLGSIVAVPIIALPTFSIAALRYTEQALETVTAWRKERHEKLGA